jgi:hypothetical protein
LSPDINIDVWRYSGIGSIYFLIVLIDIRVGGGEAVMGWRDYIQNSEEILEYRIQV